MKSGVKEKGDNTGAAKEYVEHARFSHVTEFHYFYIPTIRRKGGPAWKVKQVIGMLHEFQTDKKR